MDLRGKDVQETSPFESFLFWLKSWAGPFCCEGKTCEAYGQSLSGSILAKESTVACPLRAQGRGCVTGPANSPHCRAKIHVWSKAGILLFLQIIPTSGFSNLHLCKFRDRVVLRPHRGNIKANQFAKEEKKKQLLIFKRDLGWGRG